jgi:hypothetical protein
VLNVMSSLPLRPSIHAMNAPPAPSETIAGAYCCPVAVQTPMPLVPQRTRPEAPTRWA